MQIATFANVLEVDQLDGSFRRQVGQFRIAREIVYSDPDLVSEFFRWLGSIVVRCEMMMASDSLEYIAFSPYFESVPDGTVPSWYGVTVSRTDEGQSCFELEFPSGRVIRGLGVQHLTR